MILPHIYDVDISQPLLPTVLQPMMVTGDKLANRIGVRLKSGAQPYTPDGSCRGYVLRADGATVPILNGVVNGNEMYIDLPEAAYAVQGSVVISIVCVTSTAITTVFLGSGSVNRSQTDVVIDPGTVIDDISTLIQAIETAVASIPLDYSALSAAVTALQALPTDTVLYGSDQTLTDAQKTQARENIGAADADEIDGLTDAVQSIAGLPPEYKQIEYLESSGTQRILARPGTAPLNQDSRVVITFAQTEDGVDETNYLFGARQNTSSNGFWFTITGSGTCAFGYGAEHSTTKKITDTSIHTVDCDKNKCYVDGELIYTASSATFTTPTSGYLFAICGATTNFYYGKNRIYRYQEYADGVLVSDLIPCVRLSDNAIGMYDLVGNRFPVNSGTGAFVSGDDVNIRNLAENLQLANAKIQYLENNSDDSPDDPYRRVDYLESDGTNYFTIGRTLKSSYRMQITFSFTAIPPAGSTYYLFGGRTSSSSNAWGIGLTASGYLTAGYGAYVTITENHPGTDLHIIDYNKNKLYYDGELIRTYTEQTFETSAKGAIFATTGASDSNLYYGKCRIYGYKLYDETGTLVHDRIPVVRKADGATGFLNRISGSFVESSAPLTVGPDYTEENHFERLLEVTSLAEVNRSKVNALQDAISGRDYVQAEAERVAKKVHDVQTGNTLTFIACSDLHYTVKTGSSDGVTVGLAQDALRDMADGIKIIAEKTHIDFYACFGDVIYQWQGHEANYDNGVTEMFSVTKLLSEAFSNNPQLRMVGNHDPNCENATKEFSAYQLNSFCGIYNDMLERDENIPWGGYGLHDFERQKVRLIVLNTSYYTPEDDIPNSATRYYVGKDQADWLVSALDLSGKDDAGQWQIVVFAHVALDSSGQAKIYPYTDILAKYESGGSGSTSVDSKTTTYDFSGKNAAKLALYVNGHAHKYSWKNMRRIVSGNVNAVLQMANLYVPNALAGREEESGDGVTYTKTPATAESTAFQVITLDPVNKIVYAHHWGAGIDVVMHYNPQTVTGSITLTTTLTSPIWTSNDDTVATVSDGTITPVSTGNTMIWAKSETDNCIEVWNMSIE